MALDLAVLVVDVDVLAEVVHVIRHRIDRVIVAREFDQFSVRVKLAVFHRAGIDTIDTFDFIQHRDDICLLAMSK